MISPRPLAALALAALVALPAAAGAQTRARSPSGPADAPSIRFGGLVGLDRGDLDGIGLRADAEVDLQRLAPNLMLAGVGSFGVVRASERIRGVKVDQTRLELVPAARFLFSIVPETGVYGDIGLGLYYSNVDVGAADDSDLALMMRFGAGGFLWLNQQIRLNAELAVSPHFGDEGQDDTTVSLMVGLAFRLQ